MAISLNPDTFLREQVAQRIVNRFQLDPQKAKFTLMRFCAIGMPIGYVVAMIHLVQRPMQSNSTIGIIAGYVLFVLTAGVFAIFRQVKSPGFVSMDAASAMERMLWVLVCFMSIRESVFQATGSIAPMIAHLFVWIMTASWNAGVAAAYLNLCRRPPPRDRNKARRVAFVGC